MTSYDVDGEGGIFSKWRRVRFVTFALAWQVLFIVLFAVFVEYDPSASPRKNGDDYEAGVITDAVRYYPMFQDVHVMMFVGFGFLMTYMRRYMFSSLGLTLLIGSFVIQWATLMSGFLHLHDGKIEINVETMLLSDFACAAVLISFGALIGKVSPLQMLVCAFLEIVVFQVNEYIGLSKFHAFDVGGSMFVHVFGAYFGIAAARVLYRKEQLEEHVSGKASAQYISDVTSMIGTVFLWLFWPSFNSAIAAPGDAQHRALLNTYFALSAGAVGTFIVSACTDKRGRFEMEHIQNATLAAGVAVGTFADMNIGLWAALLTGFIAGSVSALGFTYGTPLLDRLTFHDTCGVNNLHGIPGIIAGVGGIIVAAMADEDSYGPSLYTLFPARAPESAEAIANDTMRYAGAEPGEGWSAGQQAGMQAASLGLSFGMAIVGGTITGLVMKLPIWDEPPTEKFHDDDVNWHIPELGYPPAEIPEVVSDNHNKETRLDSMVAAENGQ